MFTHLQTNKLQRSDSDATTMTVQTLTKRRTKRAASFFGLGLSLLTVFALAPQAHANIIISAGTTETQSRVARYASPPPIGFDTIVQLFTTNGTTATATEPGFSSITTSVLNAVNDTASFAANFDQSRPAGLSADLAQGVVQAQFTTSIDVNYVASGTYNSSGAGMSRLASTLYDYTAGAYVFISLQANDNTPTSFTLGGTAGNSQNQLVGSMTGTLPGGHTYGWLAQTDTQATSDDNGATGNGSISLILDGSIVPEPASAAVMSFFVVTAARKRPGRTPSC